MRSGAVASAAIIAVVAASAALAAVEPGESLRVHSGAMRNGIDFASATLHAPRYSISATLSADGSEIAGEEWLTLWNLGAKPIASVPLRLYANAASIYGGSLEILSASVDGQSAPVKQTSDVTTVIVDLPFPVPPSGSVSLNTRFVVRHGRSGYGILSSSGDVHRFAGWYPALPPSDRVTGWRVAAPGSVGDAMDADISFFDVRLSTPRDWGIAATGSQVAPARESTGEHRRFASGPVREFAFAAGPNLEPVVRSVDGVDVRYFGTSVGVTTSTSDALALAVESLAAFDRLWGPYPYAELDIVETDVSLGGYEFSGLVMLDAATRERGPADAVRWLLVHEIAHQWWYGIVGSHTVEEPWLDEAFATYAVPLALARSDADASAALIDSWRTTYGEATRAPAIGSSASDFSSWRSYRDPVYYRGAILLDDYRRQMGDAEFGALLRAAQARFRWRHLTTADFAALADEFSPGAGDAIRSIAPDD